jgi:cell division protein FtsB
VTVYRSSRSLTPAAVSRSSYGAALQRSLGHQLDQLANTDLVARIDELTEIALRLTDERDQARAETTALQRQVETLEDDLAAAKSSLRRMIREGNLPTQ